MHDFKQIFAVTNEFYTTMCNIMKQPQILNEPCASAVSVHRTIKQSGGERATHSVQPTTTGQSSKVKLHFSRWLHNGELGSCLLVLLPPTFLSGGRPNVGPSVAWIITLFFPLHYFSSTQNPSHTKFPISVSKCDNNNQQINH